MTLGEGKDKVYMLLDEHSAGGEIEHDEDIELKMAYFFDIAQKHLAQIVPVIKSYEFIADGEQEEIYMPGDFRKLYRIWRDGKNVTKRYRWKNKALIVPKSDEGCAFEIDYFAIPASITAETEDDYVFEVPEDAAQCLPYWVCAQNLLPDLVMDYSVYLAMYNLMVSQLDTSLPGDNTRIQQRLFGG